jgi:hypothetical protein
MLFRPSHLRMCVDVGHDLVNVQSVALARHPAPISLAASVFSMGEAMLVTTGVALIKDPKDWMVPGFTEVAAILYAVSLASKLCLR